MTAIFAIIIIAGLQGYAIHKGIDGKCLAITIGIIGGLAGYKIRDIFPIRK